MPCRSYETDYYVDNTNKRVADKLAKLLCGVLNHLKTENADAHYLALNDVPGLEAWWTEHQEADAAEAARLAQIKAENAAKKAALKKLTPAERKLLGVKI